MHSGHLCHLRAKHECYVLEDSVETLVRWSGKRLHHTTTNLTGKHVPNFTRIGHVL